MTHRERNKVKVVYHWFGSGNIGALAAALHLGFLATTDGGSQVATEINLPFEGGFTGKNQGSLCFVGRAREGEEIYIFPRGKKPALPLKTLKETVRLLEADPADYYLVDCDFCLKQGKSQVLITLSRIVTQVKEELAD